MVLDLTMMQSAVRLVGDEESDDGHTIERRTIGTAFFVTVPSRLIPDHRHGYLVTAHHVLNGHSTDVEMEAPNPLIDGAMHPRRQVLDWRQPLRGVDLAVAPSNALGRGLTYSAMKIEQHVLPPDTMPAIGTHIYYIGVLEPLNRTMARSGTIGAVAQEGLNHRGGYQYSAHLVDCRSYEGFSGSPCFVLFEYPGLTPEVPELATYFPNDVELKEPLGRMTMAVRFCGLFTSHLDDDRPDGVVSKYGVGVMLESSYLWGALMNKELQDERDDDDTNRLKKEKTSGPTLRPTSSGKQTEEFDRFEELTRNLLATPKPAKAEGGE